MTVTIETETETDAVAEDTAPRPRIRFGTIAWGLIICALATAMLVVLVSTESRTSFLYWLVAMTPGSILLIAVLAMGSLILLLGTLSLIRRAQRRLAKRPAAAE